MAATDLAAQAGVASAGRPRARRRSTFGPDRFTVMILALAAFLVVLALLAGQLRSATVPTAARPVIVLRRIYRTKVIETIVGSRAAGTTVSQSVSSSGAPYTPIAAPTTRTS